MLHVGRCPQAFQPRTHHEATRRLEAKLRWRRPSRPDGSSVTRPAMVDLSPDAGRPTFVVSLSTSMHPPQRPIWPAVRRMTTVTGVHAGAGSVRRPQIYGMTCHRITGCRLRSRGRIMSSSCADTCRPSLGWSRSQTDWRFRDRWLGRGAVYAVPRTCELKLGSCERHEVFAEA